MTNTAHNLARPWSRKDYEGVIAFKGMQALAPEMAEAILVMDDLRYMSGPEFEVAAAAMESVAEKLRQIGADHA